jgi:hypothetical protein
MNLSYTIYTAYIISLFINVFVVFYWTVRFDLFFAWLKKKKKKKERKEVWFNIIEERKIWKRNYDGMEWI